MKNDQSIEPRTEALKRLVPSLVYHEGGWWCQQDRVVLCKLGELATLIPPSERR
jgi:hypothetical protein